jgi:hypothetical protein
MATHEGRNRKTNVVIERIAYEPSAWETTLRRYPDAEVFHSSAWLSFLAASQGAEPVIAVVHDHGRPIGHFVGAIVRRFGIRILGSPLRGWATQSMGFLLEEGADRRAAAAALLPFAFGQLGCLHVELADRHLSAEEMKGAEYLMTTGRTFVVDLRRPEEEIFRSMHSKTRQYVRLAMRNGLRAEVATDVGFADEYHAQLREVFARQGLVPTYGVERVRQLIQCLQPTGQLLLLRIRAPTGDTLATGVAIGRNKIAVNWGAALPRANVKRHPMQLFWWEAMRYWRGRGALSYDMGGGGQYKDKYGSVDTPSLSFHRSRFGIMRVGRAAVRRSFEARQAIAGRMRRAVHSGSTADPDDSP